MKWEIAAIGAGVGGLVLGFGLGWISHARSLPRASSPSTRTYVAAKPPDPPPPFPEHPKPPLDKPTPIIDALGSASTAPTPLQGDIQKLPEAGSEETTGVEAPLSPNLSNGPPPAADLNADEALAKRIVLESGAEIVSVADARDESGTIGRSIIAETGPTSREPLRKALQKALGARAIISDAGSGATDDSGLPKLQEELATARKKRDRDRIDFLPKSPILQDEEAAVLSLERNLAARKKSSERVRLNILLRPTL